MNSSNILLVGDLVGRGRLALTAQASILTPMGLNVSYLPTALVSNNFCYVQYAMMDTTQYMRECIGVWSSLGFRFDVICVGFLASDEQVDLLAGFCREQKERGAFIMVDPIMGDNGSMYSGLGAETVARLRSMVALADLAIPNYTEACLLAGLQYSGKGISRKEAEPLADAICQLGAASVLISSAHVEGAASVIGYDGNSGEHIILPYREVPVDFSGTGDIFSAKLLSMLLKGRSLKDAAQITIEQLSGLIDTYKDVDNKSEGLPYSCR